MKFKYFWKICLQAATTQSRSVTPSTTGTRSSGSWAGGTSPPSGSAGTSGRQKMIIFCNIYILLLSIVLFLQCVPTLLCRIDMMVVVARTQDIFSVIKETSDFIHTTNCCWSSEIFRNSLSHQT